MNPHVSNSTVRMCLAGAAALVLAAPAGARVLPVDEGDGVVAGYGRGATAALVKKQSKKEFLAQYGWGAAATYAKLHG